MFQRKGKREAKWKLRVEAEREGKDPTKTEEAPTLARFAFYLFF
jgi:hypothetical protein